MFVKEIIVSEERKRNHNMCTAIFSTLTCKVMSAIHHPFILPVRFLSSTEMGGENSAEELFLIYVTDSDSIFRYTVIYLHTCEPSVLGVSKCSNPLSQFWFLNILL